MNNTLPLGGSALAALKAASLGRANCYYVRHSVITNSSGLGASPRQEGELIQGLGLAPKRLEDFAHQEFGSFFEV